MGSQVNRAARLYENWETRQSELERMGGMKPEGTYLLKLKYDFLREGLYRIRDSGTEQEKLHLFALGIVVGKLEKQLYPNKLVRWARQLKGMLLDKPRHVSAFEAKKAENIASLTAMMKKNGMAGLSGKLGNALDFESPQVSISGMQLMAGQGKLTVALQLDKQSPGVYKPSEYQVTWNPPDDQVCSCRIPAESGIGLAEAFNMLQGRGVYKGFENVEGNLVGRWVQLDRNFVGEEKPIVAFLPDDGFELKKALQEAGIQLGQYDLLKQQTLRQLESGHQVAFELSGKGSFWVQANPGAKALDFFDSKGGLLELNVLAARAQQQAKEGAKELMLIPQKRASESFNQYIYR